jgi:hypothetical protein
VWPVRVENVVVPVRLEPATMRVEVAMVGRYSVGAAKYGEKVREEIY